MRQPIFHITEVGSWEDALASGTCTGSTRDASLAEVGYIHCSFQHQVEAVANYVYDDWDGELLLLEVDLDEIPSEIRVENLDGGAEVFPHIYGPLPVKAVKSVRRLVRRSGHWKPPGDL